MFIPHAKAPAPTRSVGSITVSWGLLTIPLSVYVGSEETRIPRKEFVNGDPARPAGRAVIDKSSGAVVEADSIVKMAEANPGVFVTLSDDEIKACTLERGVAQIVSFVPRSLASGYVTEDIAQVRPQKTKGSVNAAVKMAFSLFVSAMASHDVYALVKFSLRGPARYGLITPTGDLLYVKTSDQVREALPLELMEVSEDHMNLASQLIEAVGIDDPFIIDDTAPKVRALIMAKAGGVEPTLPAPLPEAGGDLMESLMKSIEFAKAGKDA